MIALVLAAAALLYLIHLLAAVLFPVFFSLIAAYLLNPLVGWLERRRIPRIAGIAVILTGFLALLGGFALVLYPAIRSQSLRLAERLPELAIRTETIYLPWLAANLGFVLPEDVASAVARYGDNLRSALPAVLNKVGGWLGGAITTTGALISSLLNIVLIPLFLFYFLRDFERMTAAVVPLIPPARREYLLGRLAAMDAVVGHWFRGQLQVAAILTVLYSIGFGLSFHLTGLEAGTGIAVGLITGILSVVPYVGAITGTVLSLLFALLDWHGIWPFVGIAIVFGIVQFIEGYILTPRIVGEKLGLSEATVIIALLVGGSLGGLPGILFALPVTAALKIIAADLFDLYRRSSLYNPGPAPSPSPSPARIRGRAPKRRKKQQRRS